MTPEAASALNQQCFCVPVRHRDLISLIDSEMGVPGFGAGLKQSHPHLFSSTAVFLSGDDLEAMMATVSVIEHIAATKPYRQMVLSAAPAIAQIDPGPRGVLMGYDFHVTPEGPRLIEINTNAGGAFLNALLEEARNSCCTEDAGKRSSGGEVAHFTEKVVAMFLKEWALQRPASRLHHIAIVDRDPQSQYLYPEFELARHMLEASGFKVSIADPAALLFDGDALSIAGDPVDLVYNRLTDFYLQEPSSNSLRQAYLAGAVVVTPNPHHHAIYANKHNLVLFGDPGLQDVLALASDERKALARIPATEAVLAAGAEHFWDQRKQLFFKPVSGHAGKAVYRGDKLTRGVFSEILKGGYIAQKIIPPGERMIDVDGERSVRKMDVRLYTYDGELLLTAARLYQGQTTNFRTPGGGFAPVLVI